jgi:integrase
MRREDVDTAGKVWVYRPTKHKNQFRGQSREIYLGPVAQEVLRPFLDGANGAYLFSPRAARAERYAELRARRKSKVPPSQACRRKAQPKKPPGERYTTYSYRRAVQRACEAASVPAWFPHQLRHAAATNLRKEFGVEVARIILGHKSAVTTEIYAQADRERAAEVVSKVG